MESDDPIATAEDIESQDDQQIASWEHESLAQVLSFVCTKLLNEMIYLQYCSILKRTQTQNS